MRICIIAEGCYPYVVGGVSGWIHNLVKSFPEHEFIILGIVANRKQRGQFQYELPDNVINVYEAYLDDYDWSTTRKEGKRTSLKKKEYRALRSLVINNYVDWDTIFEMFQKKRFYIDDLLMGKDFLKIVREIYDKKYSRLVFSDFLWTMRSIYLPLFLMLKTRIPKADIYHCVSTGYAGIIGTMAKQQYGAKLILSEHGIYTREREEEIIKANWVKGVYKSIWIDQFKKMSKVTYDRANRVTSLYEHARELQIELGCEPKKTVVIPNGINIGRFADIPGKRENDENYFNIGAVLRVAPIKDVKTLIQAFAFAKEREDKLKLWILGPTDEDEEYANECFDLVDSLEVKDVIFTGKIDVASYMGRLDVTILTSISEGQPLTILEGFAAKIPAIATDVGNCRELIYGNDDDLGAAGIITHVMNVEEITEAILRLYRDPELRKEMGQTGYERVNRKYSIDTMRRAYDDLYESVAQEEEE